MEKSYVSKGLIIMLTTKVVRRPKAIKEAFARLFFGGGGGEKIHFIKAVVARKVGARCPNTRIKRERSSYLRVTSN